MFAIRCVAATACALVDRSTEESRESILRALSGPEMYAACLYDSGELSGACGPDDLEAGYLETPPTSCSIIWTKALLGFALRKRAAIDLG